MSSFSKFVLTALAVMSGVAASAHEASPRAVGQVLPVVSAQAHGVPLSSVRYTPHRHHRHHHRAHPVRHVR